MLGNALATGEDVLPAGDLGVEDVCRLLFRDVLRKCFRLDKIRELLL